MSNERTKPSARTQEEWITRWRQSLAVIVEEATQLRDDRDVYNEYLRIILGNSDLDKRNEFLVLIQNMYLSHILVALRRFDDRDVRSDSLRNLIAELREHRDIVTKEWFVGQYAQELTEYGERAWARFSGVRASLCERVLKNDLAALSDACSNIRSIVNKHIAHSDRQQPLLQVSHPEINQAVDVVCDLVARYYLLLDATDLDWPAPKCWTHIFDRPWRRQARMPMTYFRPEIDAMAGYVPGEQPQDGGYIKLNTNENPYPPSPAVHQAVEETLRRGLEKYPDPLAGEFRRRAAEVFGLQPDWILCGNGSDDILTIATRAFVGQGQLLRLPYPSYVLYTALAQIQGARSQEVRFRADWSLPAEFAAASDDLQLVFLPSPNSPSGTVIPPEQVLELAQRLPCPLLVDEAYVDFAETNCLELVARCEKILVSRSLSKSYALAGVRFGFVVAQPQIIAGLRKVKDSYNCDALSIAAATAAVGDQAWLGENRAKILATRRRLVAGMRELGFTTVDSQANFTWNTHPELPAKPLYERLKQDRILVRYMDYPGWGDGLRISVGTDHQIEACLERLKAIV
jgi:histidinol-phosphate aminotransferase